MLLLRFAVLKHCLQLRAESPIDLKMELERCKSNLGQLKRLMCDGDYTGQPFAQGVRETLGEHVTVQIAKRSVLYTFKVMPQRWIVERSFAWLDKNQRLWKDCEHWLNTSLQFVHLAFLALLLTRRLT